MSEDIKSLFIVEDDFGNQNVEEQAKRILRFGRASKSGSVIIDDRSLSKGDQLKLCLVIRHIASSLSDGNITREFRPIELVDILGQRMEAIGSGLSKLASEGFAKKGGPGKYSVYPHKIAPFLDYLESLGADSENGRVRARKSKGNSLTGIGRHIQQLINDRFFDTPRFISEVMDELKKEGVFRDSRVVDKTIRDSFVSMRRSLQRIPNQDGGRSKWKYTVRK